eukprot:jgi/Ulvmu1/718/UM010_0090.1
MDEVGIINSLSEPILTDSASSTVTDVWMAAARDRCGPAGLANLKADLGAPKPAAVYMSEQSHAHGAPPPLFAAQPPARQSASAAGTAHPEALPPRPALRDMRRCSLVSMGAHSVVDLRSMWLQQLNFADGGAFDFPVDAMRDEVSFLELQQDPIPPIAALLNHARTWVCRAAATLRPARSTSHSTAQQHTLASTAPEVVCAAAAHRSSGSAVHRPYNSAGGTLPDEPSHSMSFTRSLWNLQQDSDFPLENLMQCDLLCANTSVPFGHCLDPAGLRGLLCSDTGEFLDEEVPAAALSKGGAESVAEKPLGGLRGLRGMLVHARRLPQRFSLLARFSFNSRPPREGRLLCGESAPSTRPSPHYNTPLSIMLQHAACVEWQ